LSTNYDEKSTVIFFRALIHGGITARRERNTQAKNGGGFHTKNIYHNGAQRRRRKEGERGSGPAADAGFGRKAAGMEAGCINSQVFASQKPKLKNGKEAVIPGVLQAK
jgi:hypothetical protein